MKKVDSGQRKINFSGLMLAAFSFIVGCERWNQMARRLCTGKTDILKCTHSRFYLGPKGAGSTSDFILLVELIHL